MSTLKIDFNSPPILDPEFVPAVLWNRAYRQMVENDPESAPLAIALSRPDGTVFVEGTRVLPHRGENEPLNIRHVERLLKFMLWQKGGSRVSIAGHDGIAKAIADLYRPGGRQAFDHDIIGRKMFLDTFRVEPCALEDLPERRSTTVSVGRNLDGCRIGFDLGGSDRKCAAVIDGKQVHSEEVEWAPYFEKDPSYHFEGIMDSLRRAAKHMPRVDAIGGSAAGVYVNNEVRVASLFRGVSEKDFDEHVRRIFFRVQKEWDGVPLEVANDGEVTALAGSMSLDDTAVLGISMGTSQAAGYCDAEGHITGWLNELAFVPVDYRDDAPADEWSGDIGCGVQYFSQQAVARLAPRAGLEFPSDMALADRLVEVQQLMDQGNDRARKIYETIGAYFGYSIPWYARFYEIRNLLILGRVTSGPGGEIIIARARDILEDEFPDLATSIRMTTPDEKFKRHGQAIAAASLPRIGDGGGSRRSG